jgi:hypothetical protein
MIGKEFINSVANRKLDIIQMLLDILAETGSRYCLIGGLAVNAYVEPVVSLNLDIVAAIENIEAICKAAKERGFRVERFEHSVDLTSESSESSASVIASEVKRALFTRLLRRPEQSRRTLGSDIFLN